MKVLSYNILAGGFSGYDYSLKQPERLNLIKEVITKTSPDFVGLIDTFRWDSEFTNKELKDIFGFKNCFCINLNDERLKKKGHNNGITVLTNLNAKFEKARLATRDTIKAKLKYKEKFLDIFTVYLDDLSEDTRLSQLKELFKLVDEKNPTIFMGDLNTIDPDELEKPRELFTKILNDPEFKKRPDYESHFKKCLNDIVKGNVLDYAKKEGWKNVAEGFEKDETFPTSLHPINMPPIARIDHVLYKGNIKILDYKCLKGELFEKASDHYPIFTEIELA